MIKKIYDMTLKLITPSEKGNQLDFASKQDDVLEAACFFNEKFRSWSKRMIIYMISKKSIHLLLFLENEKGQENVSAREIRFFTTYLNNQKSWNEYSRNNSKLFESVNTSLCSLEAAQSQIDGINRGSDMFNLQTEDVEYVAKEYLKLGSQQMQSPKNVEDKHTISDEDIIVIVSYLVQTKNKGENHAQKAETIMQLKNILKRWL